MAAGLLTLVVFSLQLLRLGPMIAEAGAGAGAVLWASLWATPAILSVTLPLGWLFAVVLTARELHTRGDLVALRTVGFGPGAFVGSFLLLGLVPAAATTTVAAWLGPVGLERASERLVQIYLVDRVTAAAGAPVMVGPDLALAAKSAGNGEYRDIWLVHGTMPRPLVAKARRLNTTSDGLELEDAVLTSRRWPGTGDQNESSLPDTLITRHRHVVLRGESLGGLFQPTSGWLDQLPWFERATLPELFVATRLSDDDERASRGWGALAKRANLAFAPLLLTLVAVPLSAPPTLTRRTGGRLTLAAATIVGAAGYFALIRQGELAVVTGAHPAAGLLPVYACIAAIIAVVLWWRSRW